MSAILLVKTLANTSLEYLPENNLRERINFIEIGNTMDLIFNTTKLNVRQYIIENICLNKEYYFVTIHQLHTMMEKHGIDFYNYAIYQKMIMDTEFTDFLILIDFLREIGLSFVDVESNKFYKLELEADDISVNNRFIDFKSYPEKKNICNVKDIPPIILINKKIIEKYT